MNTGARRWLLVVWALFLARGAFYSAFVPLWEGYDEWAHFAYVQRLAYGGSLPEPQRTRVSREVRESLGLTPLAWATVGLPVSYETHDTYWRLPPAEREARRSRLMSLPREWAREETTANVQLYEAQQSPLYYLLLAPLQLTFASVSLPARVLLMRLASLLITSLTIPLAFATARLVLGSEALAVAVSALIAALPSFVMAASHLGNDGLSAAIFAALLWAVLSAEPLKRWRRWLLPGLLLGAGLITKAYFLTALPALAFIYAWSFVARKEQRKPILWDAACTFALAGAISAWWYWRNWALTGAWSGLQQVAVLRDRSFAGFIQQAVHVNWLRWLDTTFFTHIWFGNWSFLQLRSWIYRFFACLAVVAVLGLLMVILRNRDSLRRSVLALSSFTGFFLLGLAYHELTFSFQGVSSGAGWYLSAIVAAEALLAVLGLMAVCPSRGQHWVTPGLTACFMLLELYATHFVMIPYYTGMIAHRPNGALASFHLSQLTGGGLQTIAGRLGEGALPSALILVLYPCYLAATLSLPLLAARMARGKLS